MPDDNIHYLYPEQAKKKRQRRWDCSEPPVVFRQPKELTEFPSKKFEGDKEVFWKMVRYIRSYGLYPSVVTDLKGSILGGAVLVKKAQSISAYQMPVVQLPITRLKQKWAFCEAYRYIEAEANKKVK